MFKERKLRKLIKKNKFDQEKLEFLENYIAKLREQLGILKNEKEVLKKEHEIK
jgi:hypothetical protein